MRELLRLLGSTVSPASRALLPALFLMVAAPLALPLNATAGDPACSDGLDNDGDGLVDVGEDPGCADAADESERSAGLVCDDGEDNDGDGRADFPGDTGCSEPLDSSEVSDQDTDGVVDVLDNCPFASNPDQTDSDGNQIGDPCECGDQNGDATVNVLDILAINDAIFNPALVTDLCDTNHDNRCNVLDLIGANNKIFGAPAYCSRYPGPSGPLSSPPSVSNLRLSETSFPLPQTGQRFPLTVELDFSDPDRDLVQLILTLTGPQGPLFRFLDEFKSVEVAGSASRSISIDSSFPAGNYTVSAQLVDSVESESNVESTGFIVDASVPAPIAITDVSPPSGQAGDTVTLTGSGFTSVSEEALRISFLRGQRSAELVSVLADELQVIVPDGAITGPILLESPIGITQSAVPFSVVATISVFPETYELLRGESVDLACTLSGTPTSIADWSIASGSDPALGSVDESGVYAAPADLPPTNPVVVRCASRDDPQLFADAAVTVLPPAPMPGQATILAQAGGEVFTADREVTASIPPGSLAQDADLAIDIPAAATLPPVTDNTVHVASAQLDPPGVDFAVPASVSFSLRHWVQPGTALTVTDLAGAPAPSPGSPVAAAVVGTAIVDASGRLAVAELDQTGAYAVDADLAIAKSTAAGLLETLIGSTGWRLSRPRDTELLEGLTVPVLIEPIDGNPGQGIGPFFEGVEVEATLDGVPPQDNPLRAGPRVQPDATAWKLGTFIHIPVLPDCGEGESRTGRLRVRYPSGTGSTAELVLVFTFDCLDELRFTFGEPPDPIPAGSLWEILGEKRRLSLLPDAYRFSEIDVGSNAELRVRPDQAVFTGPLTLEVTSDVRVNSGAAIATDFLGGAVDTGFLSDPCPWWTSPIPGILERGPQCGLGAGHFGFFEGPGGVGGKWHGGRGGEGGAYDGRSDRGESGQHAAFGGSGGEGGEPWEFQSPLNVVASAFDLVTSALQGDFVGVALAAYDLTSTSVKVLHNDENKITGTGRGGQAARRRQNGLTDPPQAGGGGGGGGKTYIDCSFLFIDFCSDENGSGGGGGGGGAHPLNLRAGGDVVVEVNGAITGIGGPGGLGGGGFFETSGGGGGGAGGNGAYIRITANELFNLGKLSTAGGIPGLSQYCPGQNLGNIDGEYCIFSDVFLIDTGIGERGRDGAFSVRAGFRGQLPIDSNFSIAGPTDPWAQEHEFLFPGLGDTDGDGLKDGLEDHIGTDKTSADPDLDGLTDFEEVLETGTDPNLRDTDGDGLSDGDELSANPFVTDPLLADTDGDGFEDGFEIDKGSSPVDENSTPEICDGSDNDLDGQTDEDCELRLDHKGREFFVPFLPTLDTDGLDPTLKLLITSEGFADVTVEYPVGNVIDTVAVTPDAPGEVTVPVTASTDWVPWNPRFAVEIASNAVRVTATFDVTVVAENRKAFVADRALALPVELLGQEHRIMAWNLFLAQGASQFVVVATENGTTVTVDNLPFPGGPLVEVLNRGEGFLVQSGFDLLGVRVVADKKIVVANGNDCAKISSGQDYCEHLYEIALPVERWGTDYLARHNRTVELQFDGLERTYYRIVAAQDGTDVSVNGTLWASPLNAGDGADITPDDTVYDQQLDLMHFSATKPILVSQFMSSICEEWPTDPTCDDPFAFTEVSGDASMTNLVPTGRFPRLHRFTDAGCGWTTAVNVIAPTSEAQSDSVLVNGVAVQAAEFTAFPSAPQWSAATAEVSCALGQHTSESPSGHTLSLVALGFNSAMTAPLGYDYEQAICSGELGYDSGAPGWHLAVSEGSGLAVRFTPSRYPWTFDLARFWPWSSSSGLVFEVHVWDDDGPGGLPGSDLITPFSHQAVNTDEWEEVSLPRVTVQSGDFYIGWIQPAGGLYFNGRDDDLPSSGRSYVLASDGSWKEFSEVGEEHDLMVRQACRSEP